MPITMITHPAAAPTQNTMPPSGCVSSVRGIAEPSLAASWGTSSLATPFIGRSP